MDQEFPSNTHKERANPLTDKTVGPKAIDKSTKEKVVEQIVDGGVTIKKAPWHQRFTKTFFGSDIKSVKDHVVQDLVVPSIKNTIVDVVIETAERAILGEVRSRRSPIGGFRGGLANHVNYASITKGAAARREDPREVIDRRARANHDFGMIVFDDRARAEQVVLGLAALVDEFGLATVADLYTMIGQSSEYTDNGFGWEDLRGADVIGSNHRGWSINLPRPQKIN